MSNIKKSIAALVIVFMSVVFLTECYGQYALFKRFHSWNGKAIKNKWLKSCVHLIFWIIPVYGICLLVDFFILNTLEFWTGSNPLAMGPDDKEIQVVKYKGEQFQITATQNRFDIKQLTGKKAGNITSLVFDPIQSAWFAELDSKQYKLVEIDKDNNDIAYVIGPDKTVTKFHLPTEVK